MEIAVVLVAQTTPPEVRPEFICAREMLLFVSV